MRLRTHLAASAPMFAMALTASAAALVVAVAYVPAETLRTVQLDNANETQAPAEWTARVIRNGWDATDSADRANACKATPAQLRAAAPHTSYDPARYDVETAIVTLSILCQKG